jgi:hypothetical protein
VSRSRPVSGCPALELQLLDSAEEGCGFRGLLEKSGQFGDARLDLPQGTLPGFQVGDFRSVLLQRTKLPDIGRDDGGGVEVCCDLGEHGLLDLAGVHEAALRSVATSVPMPWRPRQSAKEAGKQIVRATAPAAFLGAVRPFRWLGVLWQRRAAQWSARLRSFLPAPLRELVEAHAVDHPTDGQILKLARKYFDAAEGVLLP